MTGLMTLLTGLSLAALAALSIHRFYKEKNWRLFAVQMLALALCFWFLRALFGFPSLAPTPRGEQDVYLVIVLYGCMLLGMAAHWQLVALDQSKPRHCWKVRVGPRVRRVFGFTDESAYGGEIYRDAGRAPSQEKLRLRV